MNEYSPEQARRSWFSRWNVFVLGAVIFLLFALAIPALLNARAEARRAMCAHSLLQIGLGLQIHHDVHKSFPPAYMEGEDGRPWHSWRVRVDAFLSSDLFYDGYYFKEEPWDGPRNLKSIEEQRSYVYCYTCPAIPVRDEMKPYLAVVGAETAWPGPKPSHIRDFAKGTAHSIMVVEQMHSDIRWGEPRDFEFDRFDLAIHAPSYFGSFSPPPSSAQTISSLHRGGANVMFADGSVEFLPVDTSPELLEDMLVIAGDKPKIPLGPRKRDRMVYDPDLYDTDMKSLGYRRESYIMDETSEANR